MACLMAGMLGCGGGPPTLFFPSRCFEAAGLEKGVSDHRHQGMSMQASPRSAFEMIEAEFLLELLMSLFANPSGFDRGGERFEARIGWQVGHIVFLFARRSAFADEPNLLARHTLHAMIAHSVLVAIGDTNATRREETRQPAFRAPPPTDLLPCRVGQRRFGGDRRLIRDVVFARLPRFCDREHQRDIRWVNVLTPRQPHRPQQIARAQRLTEGSA